MIAIIDYGMGNLLSVSKAFAALGLASAITADPAAVRAAERVVLPGVGAFGDAMANLKRLGLDAAFVDAVRAGKPCLGICLGLQLLFTASEEGGLHQGLNLIPGRVARLPALVKVPHMGWNQVDYAGPAAMFRGIPSGSYFYFVHSYYGLPDDPRAQAASSQHGIRFACALSSGNLWATQFHPEKSGAMGLKILQNFSEVAA